MCIIKANTYSMILDAKLRWKTHLLRKKRLNLKQKKTKSKVQKNVFLVAWATLNTYNKLLYKLILKPV